MRTEATVEGEATVMLMDLDAQTMYMYMPSQGMAFKLTFEEPESAVEEAQSILGYNPVIIGTETLDGKVCLVVEYTVEGSTAKMWIWKDQGFPIRAEITTTEGTIIMEYANIEFVDIPDSMFELPEGVQIQEIPGF